MDVTAPVIAIDGTAASGKGTLAASLATSLGFHYLDSGLFYRVCAWCVRQQQIPFADTQSIVSLAKSLVVTRVDGQLYINGQTVDESVIRTVDISLQASHIAVLAPVREALLVCQRAYRRSPGLVAEGRDMASVVFPDAMLKIYLTASLTQRALRRYQQLIKGGKPANLSRIKAQIFARDQQDMSRIAAPLQLMRDAKPLDTSVMKANEALQQALIWWYEVKPTGDNTHNFADPVVAPSGKCESY